MRISIDPDSSKINFGTVIHIPQLNSENFEVNLEDVASMTNTVSPKEITIPCDSRFTADPDGYYFRDSTPFYSWNKNNDIKDNLCYYYCKLGYDFSTLLNSESSNIDINQLISDIKNKYSKPKIKEENVVKNKSYKKDVKYRRRYLSQDLKRYIIKQIDSGINSQKLSKELMIKVKQINFIYRKYKAEGFKDKNVKYYKKLQKIMLTL